MSFLYFYKFCFLSFIFIILINSNSFAVSEILTEVIHDDQIVAKEASDTNADFSAAEASSIVNVSNEPSNSENLKSSEFMGKTEF